MKELKISNKKFAIEFDITCMEDIIAFKNGGADAVFRQFCDKNFSKYDEGKHYLKAVCRLNVMSNCCTVSVEMHDRDKYVKPSDDDSGVAVEYEWIKTNVLTLVSIGKVMPRMYETMLILLSNYQNSCLNSVGIMRYKVKKLEQDIKDTENESVRVGNLVQAIKGAH